MSVIFTKRRHGWARSRKTESETKQMTRPTEQQLKDPKWWDESTSKDAVGCWVVTEDDGRFVKTVFVHDPREGVVMNELQRAKYFSRPAKPEPKEWDGEGLPPAGIQCECYHADLNGRKQWIECDVVGPYGDYVICAPNGGGFYGFDPDELRPLRTKKQRERDETIAAAIQACPYPGSETTKVDVEALYDAGLLRKAGDE